MVELAGCSIDDQQPRPAARDRRLRDELSRQVEIEVRNLH